MRKPGVWLVGGDDVRFRLPLLIALRERGFDVGVAGSEEGGVFAEHGIPYRRYFLERGVNPWSDRRTRNELLELFRKGRPDIVHAFDTKPVILAPSAAKRAGVPATVCTITGLGYVFSSHAPLPLTLRPAFLYLHWKALRISSFTVFQNEEDRRFFLRMGIVPRGRDILIRSSGIDVDHVAASRQDGEALARLRRELGLERRIVVTMVARLVTHKGVPEYLRAARRVRARIPEAIFLLVGPLASEGSLAVPRSELDAYADDVLYLGERRDVLALLALSDLFVLPSYNREGVPRVLLEAGSVGLPLVTTDIPGCRDVVRDGWNGLLVPPRDAAALASAIEKLLTSRERLKLMGTRSRSHVEENFSLRQVADAYGGLYERALQEGATRREIVGGLMSPSRPAGGAERSSRRSRESGGLQGGRPRGLPSWPPRRRPDRGRTPAALDRGGPKDATALLLPPSRP